MTGDRDLPMLTVKEAVTATQTSESTIKRRLRSGAFPNAVQTTEGKWVIPLGDLSAAGLRPGRMAGPDPVTRSDDRVHDLAAENDELRRQLAAETAELRQRLAVAEALAGERNRIIEVQQQMLRMLEAASPASAQVHEPAPAPQPQSTVAATPTGALARLRRRFSAGG